MATMEESWKSTLEMEKNSGLRNSNINLLEHGNGTPKRLWFVDAWCCVFLWFVECSSIVRSHLRVAHVKMIELVADKSRSQISLQI